MPGSWQVPEPISVFKVRASGGASIFVRRHGGPNGPRMVLSHVNGFAIDAYYPFWSHFTGLFDVFVHDIRNHGWNPVGDRRAHNLPTFVDDAERIVREIDRRFGKNPRIGVFHSLSSIVALRQASAGGDGFSALVLFDPPVCPPGGFPEDMEGIGRKLCDGADPTVPSSFMPSMDLSQLIHVDYDFVPETSHFLQFEEPERCAAMTLACLEGRGLI